MIRYTKNKSTFIILYIVQLLISRKRAGINILWKKSYDKPRQHIKRVVIVQLLSCVQLFGTPWTAAHQASQSITISQSLFKLMSIRLVMTSNHIILCPSLYPPAFNLSHNQGFFLISQLFTSRGQSVGVSASALVLPMSIQG